MFWTSTDKVSKLLIWFSCKEFVSFPSHCLGTVFMHSVLFAVKGALVLVQVFRSFYFSKLFSQFWNEEQFTWCVDPTPLHTAIQDIVLILLPLLAVVGWAGGAGLVCWSDINLLDLGMFERFPCSSCHRVFHLTRFSAHSLSVDLT